MSGAPDDLLATIVAATRKIIEVRRGRVPDAQLEQAALARTPDAAGFVAALRRPDRLNVIAECKRRSPSRGVLRAEYDPVEIATSYAAAGAAAISVLTEPAFFDGALEHLTAVRAAVSIPCLRKDFIVDRYQMLEARMAGADAILLIVAALSADSLRQLLADARSLGLAALVEVHGDDEINVALDAGADVIGVNNRNLRTLAVSIDASERLIERLPRGCVAVAESGLRTHDDLVRLSALGYNAFLIGERFMTSPRPGDALESVLRGERVGTSGGLA